MWVRMVSNGCNRATAARPAPAPANAWAYGGYWVAGGGGRADGGDVVVLDRTGTAGDG